MPDSSLNLPSAPRVQAVLARSNHRRTVFRDDSTDFWERPGPKSAFLCRRASGMPRVAFAQFEKGTSVSFRIR